MSIRRGNNRPRKCHFKKTMFVNMEVLADISFLRALLTSVRPVGSGCGTSALALPVCSRAAGTATWRCPTCRTVSPHRARRTAYPSMLAGAKRNWKERLLDKGLLALAFKTHQHTLSAYLIDVLGGRKQDWRFHQIAHTVKLRPIDHGMVQLVQLFPPGGGHLALRRSPFLVACLPFGTLVGWWGRNNVKKSVVLVAPFETNIKRGKV